MGIVNEIAITTTSIIATIHRDNNSNNPPPSKQQQPHEQIEVIAIEDDEKIVKEQTKENENEASTTIKVYCPLCNLQLIVPNINTTNIITNDNGHASNIINEDANANGNANASDNTTIKTSGDAFLAQHMVKCEMTAMRNKISLMTRSSTRMTRSSTRMTRSTSVSNGADNVIENDIDYDDDDDDDVDEDKSFLLNDEIDKEKNSIIVKDSSNSTST